MANNIVPQMLWRIYVANEKWSPCKAISHCYDDDAIGTNTCNTSYSAVESNREWQDLLLLVCLSTFLSSLSLPLSLSLSLSLPLSLTHSASLPLSLARSPAPSHRRTELTALAKDYKLLFARRSGTYDTGGRARRYCDFSFCSE